MHFKAKIYVLVVSALFTAGILACAFLSTTNTTTDARNVSVTAPLETDLHMEYQAVCELTGSNSKTQEGWITYFDNNSCVKFEMPANWKLYQGDDSLAISSPAKESANLETYELFSIKKLNPSSMTYRLNMRGRLGDDWTAVGDSTFMLKDAHPDSKSHYFVHYTDDGRIYRYSFQVLTEKDVLIMNHILETLVIK